MNSTNTRQKRSTTESDGTSDTHYIITCSHTLGVGVDSEKEMSYARWSNSAWYAFANCNGKLSLWYDLDHTIDWDNDHLEELLQYEDEAAITELVITYDCTRDEAKEALEYVHLYISEGKAENFHSDKDYQESTLEEAEEFHKKRNYHYTNTDNPIDFHKD